MSCAGFYRSLLDDLYTQTGARVTGLLAVYSNAVLLVLEVRPAPGVAPLS